ncbi:hypothetical protein L1887_17797 [Cichorium endivia]|nr:hypothetical protein L1887_17797 [Cichorium endivia]
MKLCYDRESKTFTFGRDRNIHLYFGLEDVYYIGGIPVDREPILCDDEKTEVLCTKYLGECDDYNIKKMMVRKKWLRERFEEVSENTSKGQLDYYVRAHNVKGPTMILELFFFERIPRIRNAYLRLGRQGSSYEGEKRFPLHYHWCPLMVNLGRVTQGRFSTELNEIRDSLVVEDIVWTPYRAYESYRRQRIFFRTIMFNFGTLLYHQPEKGARQLQINNLTAVKEDAVQPTSARGTRNIEYPRRYVNEIKLWKESRYDENNCIRDLSKAFELPPLPDESSNILDPIIAEEESDDQVNDSMKLGDYFNLLKKKKASEKEEKSETSESIPIYGTMDNFIFTEVEDSERDVNQEEKEQRKKEDKKIPEKESEEENNDNGKEEEGESLEKESEGEKGDLNEEEKEKEDKKIPE